MCHAAGQTRPTPILLRYGPGDWNALHRDLYGDLVFPLQVVINLNDPGVDHTGGEFLLVEQRPRAQSRGTATLIPHGHGLVFTTRDRPVRRRPRLVGGAGAARRVGRSAPASGTPSAWSSTTRPEPAACSSGPRAGARPGRGAPAGLAGPRPASAGWSPRTGSGRRVRCRPGRRCCPAGTRCRSGRCASAGTGSPTATPATADDVNGARVLDLPDWLAELGRRVLADAYGEAAAAAYRPDTALVNWYDADARMGMHQDKDEVAAEPGGLAVGRRQLRVPVRHPARPRQAVHRRDAGLRRRGGLRRGEPVRLPRGAADPARHRRPRHRTGRRADQRHDAGDRSWPA